MYLPKMTINVISPGSPSTLNTYICFNQYTNSSFSHNSTNDYRYYSSLFMFIIHYICMLCYFIWNQRSFEKKFPDFSLTFSLKKFPWLFLDFSLTVFCFPIFPVFQTRWEPWIKYYVEMRKNERMCLKRAQQMISRPDSPEDYHFERWSISCDASFSIS